jgi:hypothetical protein
MSAHFIILKSENITGRVYINQVKNTNSVIRAIMHAQFQKRQYTI